MDLRKAFDQIVAALDKRAEELTVREERLGNKEIALGVQEEALFVERKRLEEERKTVKDIVDVKAQREANGQRTKDLDAKDAELKRVEIKLKKYENDLFEIKTRQDATDLKLAERERELTQREKTYKEDIERNFAANLAKNILNK